MQTEDFTVRHSGEQNAKSSETEVSSGVCISRFLFGRRSLRGSTVNFPLKKNCITLTIMQCFIFSLYGSRRVPLAHFLFAPSTPSSFASAGLLACSSSLFGRRSLRGSTANFPLKKNCITLTIMQCFIFSLYGSRRVPLAHLLFAPSTPSSFASAGLLACSSSVKNKSLIYRLLFLTFSLYAN